MDQELTNVPAPSVEAVDSYLVEVDRVRRSWPKVYPHCMAQERCCVPELGFWRGVWCCGKAERVLLCQEQGFVEVRGRGKAKG